MRPGVQDGSDPVDGGRRRHGAKEYLVWRVDDRATRELMVEELAAMVGRRTARIRNLLLGYAVVEGLIGLAEVIDPAKMSGSVKFGATVTIVDEDTDEEKTYQIVGEPEADIESGRLNIKSPLARALIGKDEGDSVEVRTPGGEKSYEILSVSYK